MAYFDPAFIKPQNPDAFIPKMTMDQIQEKLCAKSGGDVLKCIDCEGKCQYGKRAVELLEKETSRTVMNGKQVCDIRRRMDAMMGNLEVLQNDNPVQFIMQKYGFQNDRQAKQKMHYWKHVYGNDKLVIATQISDMQNTLATAQIVNKTKKEPEPMPEPGHATKRQEEKISQSCLERTRREMENDILKAEEEIKEHERAIELCKKRMDEDTQKIQAIRQVLEIFKKKNEVYV